VAILVRALKAADQDGRIRSVLVVLLLRDGGALSGVTAVSPVVTTVAGEVTADVLMTSL
jgi:hypothetical protein